jgi:multiple sugar transport system substrate-binding protein
MTGSHHRQRPLGGNRPQRRTWIPGGAYSRPARLDAEEVSTSMPIARQRWLRGPARMLAVMLAAILLVATGCGGGSGKADGVVTLKFWKYQDPVQQPVLEKLIKKYNAAHTGVKVELETFPFDQYLSEKVLTSLSAGNGPDVFWVSAATVLNFAPQNLLLPLQDTFTKDLRKDFLPQSLDSITFGENIYGVPHEMGLQGLLYDKKLFSTEGLEAPATWDDLASVSERIKTRSRSGILLPTSPDVFQNFIWWPFLWQGGGEVVDDGFTKAMINEPAGVAALDLWRKLYTEKLAAPKSAGAFGDELGQGTVGMAALGMWPVSNFTKNYPDLEVGAAPLPIPDGGTPSAAFGGWYTAVSAATDHPKEAKDFAVWLFGKDKENALDLVTAMTTLSPRISVTEELKSKPEFQKEPLAGFFPIWETARPEPAYPPEINQAVTDALQAVMFGGKSAQEAADAAAKTIDDYLKTPSAEKIRAMNE